MEWSEWIEFTEFGIGSAPTTFGVYCLADAAETTYIAAAAGQDGIKGRLLDHLAGKEGECTRSARRYRFRVCSDPLEVEYTELTAFFDEHGRNPKCNGVVPAV